MRETFYLHSRIKSFIIIFTNLLTFFINISPKVTFYVNPLVKILMFLILTPAHKTFFFFFFPNRGRMTPEGAL